MSYVALRLFRQPALPVALPAETPGYRLRVAFRPRHRSAAPRVQ
jgi:hypothetical protein